MTSASRALLVAATLILVAATAGCGNSSAGSGTTLEVGYGLFPDALDPAVATGTEAIDTMQNVYIPLLTYAHADGLAGTRVIPGLARALPRISDGGCRYELRLRPGLRYSDGTPVRASDFRFAIERLFRVNSAGSPFYTDIVGAERFAKTRRGGIPGISADDGDGRIVIRLKRPRGTFSYELALLYSAPLPPDTPEEPLPTDPPAATGPYAISEVKPPRSLALTRNPVWDDGNAGRMPQLPGGHFETIDVKVNPNRSSQVNEVERGSLDWMKGPPPPDRLPELRSRYLGTQFRPQPTISLLYFWMNTRKPPFDDVLVRRAVNYAINPSALERIYAGTLKATQQVLPPGMPGYRRFALYPHDPTRARQLIARAHPRDREVTVWTDDSSPNDEAGEYLVEVLEGLGLKPKLKLVDSASYFQVIGDSSTRGLDIGWGSWLLDYPNPNDYFQPQLTGESIAPVNNTNWARFSDPSLNARVARLGAEQLGPHQEAEYAALDRAVMARAPWAPIGNLMLSTFVSKAIDLDRVIYSPNFGQDLTSFEPAP